MMNRRNGRATPRPLDRCSSDMTRGSLVRIGRIQYRRDDGVMWLGLRLEDAHVIDQVPLWQDAVIGTVLATP